MFIRLNIRWIPVHTCIGTTFKNNLTLNSYVIHSYTPFIRKHTINQNNTLKVSLCDKLNTMKNIEPVYQGCPVRSPLSIVPYHHQLKLHH